MKEKITDALVTETPQAKLRNDFAIFYKLTGV